MPIKAGRISVSRSAYDMKPEDEPPDLIDFTMRGRRGATLGRDVINRRGAVALWEKLGSLLGKELEKAIRESERKRVAAWLQHIDRLDEIPGAQSGLPKFNPLWDAAEKIKELP
jgi:hypothetical protein